MKNILLYTYTYKVNCTILKLASAIIFWFVVSCGDKEDIPVDTQGWQELKDSPASPTYGRHDDLFFLNENLGWLVNIRGEVYSTKDGGVTWVKISQSTIFNRCVGFATEKKGWIGNFNTFNTPKPNQALFETIDGGATWLNISDRISGAKVDGLCGLQVLDQTTIFAVGRWCGPPVFVKSIDGGASWDSQDLSQLVSGLVDVHFFNQNEGFVVGALGDGKTTPQQLAAKTAILGTVDGGKTWSRKYLDDNSGNRGWKIHFVSRDIGFVSTEGATADGIILKTVDGGENWVKVPVVPNLPFEGIAFVDASLGWVGSESTSLYQTKDGGTSWKRLNIGVSVNRIRVVDGKFAIACGNKIYKWTR